jgi:retron-type reverse transcriptase
LTFSGVIIFSATIVVGRASRREPVFQVSIHALPLGIPMVLDRVIQQAIAQVIAPLFEVRFSEHS